MNIIDSLTTETILSNELPINELLENSLYYPSSGFDGGVVRYSTNIQSFIYCDYAKGKEAFIHQMNNFHGYRLVGHRPIRQDELIPNGWEVRLPPRVTRDEYFRHRDVFKEPFAHWAVYERLENVSDTEGPDKFSLIYIGGEGVATYQALYWSNKKFAKALALIQPGAGFGFNWTHYMNRNGPLAWVVFNNQFGYPDTIFYGGYGYGYYDLNWDEYELVNHIKSYYTQEPFGEVTIWTRRINTEGRFRFRRDDML